MAEDEKTEDNSRRPLSYSESFAHDACVCASERKSGWQATQEPMITHDARSHIARASLTNHASGRKSR